MIKVGQWWQRLGYSDSFSFDDKVNAVAEQLPCVSQDQSRAQKKKTRNECICGVQILDLTVSACEFKFV